MQDKFAELKDMQAQFDILMEMEDDDADGIHDSLNRGNVKNIEGEGDGTEKKYSKKQIAKAFVNRIVCGLRRKELPEDDQKIMDLMTEADPNDDGESDGGFTVPQDISTDIRELRRTENDLEMYVNVEPVRTLSGFQSDRT